MLIRGAEAMGLSNSDCILLLEDIEDTQNYLVSLLTFLIYAERKKVEVDRLRIAEWEALLRGVIEIEYSLPNSDISQYQHALAIFKTHISQLKHVTKQYETEMRNR